MFIWDIQNEKYHKGYPYKNIIKILGNIQKLIQLKSPFCIRITLDFIMTFQKKYII